MKHVAVVGATGAVGERMIALLEERRFPIASIRFLASTRSLGKTVLFRGEHHPVDELNADAQMQLLRYIRAFETALSAEKPGLIPAPAQVICTSRRPLRTHVLTCGFLPEIYYRLNAISFSLPPLRDRKEDIPSLTQMFIDTVSREQQRPIQGLGPGSLPILLRHLWPGNDGLCPVWKNSLCRSGDRAGAGRGSGCLADADTRAGLHWPVLGPGQGQRQQPDRVQSVPLDSDFVR